MRRPNLNIISSYLLLSVKLRTCSTRLHSPSIHKLPLLLTLVDQICDAIGSSWTRSLCRGFCYYHLCALNPFQFLYSSGKILCDHFRLNLATKFEPLYIITFCLDFVIFLNCQLIITEPSTQRSCTIGFDVVTYLIHRDEERREYRTVDFVHQTHETGPIKFPGHYTEY